MTEEKNTNIAETGTKQPIVNRNGFWSNLGNENGNLPFFSPGEDTKRRGFTVQFLSPEPKRETSNRFNPERTDCWFDINYLQKVEDENGGKKEIAEKKTWSISQISLLSALKGHSPLTNKIFSVRLVRVDQTWRERFPNYKGIYRYDVEYLGARELPKEVMEYRESVEPSKTSAAPGNSEVQKGDDAKVAMPGTLVNGQEGNVEIAEPKIEAGSEGIAGPYNAEDARTPGINAPAIEEVVI